MRSRFGRRSCRLRLEPLLEIQIQNTKIIKTFSSVTKTSKHQHELVLVEIGSVTVTRRRWAVCSDLSPLILLCNTIAKGRGVNFPIKRRIQGKIRQGKDIKGWKLNVRLIPRSHEKQSFNLVFLCIPPKILNTRSPMLGDEEGRRRRG